MTFKTCKICAATLLLFAAAQGIFAQASAADAERAFGVLEDAMDVLAYQGDYSATLSLVIERPGKPKENLQYKVFQRVGADLMTVVQLFPEADKGTGYLRDGENLWAYDPIGRKFSHSSIKEALGDSDVKLDDIDQEKARWRANYNVESIEDDTLGSFSVHKITLTAKTSEPAYARTTYYIRQDIPLMLKEEDFSSNGRLMRTVLIPRYAKLSTGYVGVQTIVRDELNKGENTQQVISDLVLDTLPDYIFTRAYLEGLN